MRLLKALLSRRGFRLGFVPPEPLDSKIAKHTKDYGKHIQLKYCQYFFGFVLGIQI